MARMTIKKLGILKVSSIFGLVGIALTAHAQYAHSDSAPLTIEAQGRGDVQVKPDSAIIRLSVVSRGTTAQEAVKHNDLTDEAIAHALLAKALVHKEAIKTSQSSVTSNPTNGFPFEQRWRATDGLTAEVPADENVKLLDALTADTWAHVMGDVTKDNKSKVSIYFSAQADTAKDAEEMTKAHMQKITDMLKAKVPDAGIHPYELRITAPQPTLEPGAAYTARTGLLIHVDSVDSIPAVVDEAKAAGADSVFSVEFAVRDSTKARAEAIYEGTKEAKLKAQAEAAALGKKLGPLLKSSVPETPSGSYYRGGGVAVRRRQADQTSCTTGESAIGSGDVHVSADVTLTYSTR